MSNYKFYLNNVEITDDIINFSYSENLEDVASSFSFNALKDYGLTSIDSDGNERINTIKIFDNQQKAPLS